MPSQSLCFLLGWAAVSGPLCTIACTSDYLRLKTTITGIEREGDRITRVITHQGAVSGDKFALALGLHRADDRTRSADLPDTIPTDGYPEAPTVGMRESTL